MRLRRRHRSRWCPPERVDDPAGDVIFPDPTGYDVIVPARGALARVRRRAASAPGWAPRQSWCATPPTRGCAARRVLRRSTAGAGVRRVGRAVDRPGDRLVRRRHRPTRPGARRARGSSGISTGGRCRPAQPRSPAPRTASQAFVLGRALALQFHPEIDQLTAARVVAGRRPRRRGRRRRAQPRRITRAHNRTRATTPRNESAAWCAASWTHVARQPCPSS